MVLFLSPIFLPDKKAHFLTLFGDILLVLMSMSCPDCFMNHGSLFRELQLMFSLMSFGWMNDPIGSLKILVLWKIIQKNSTPAWMDVDGVFLICFSKQKDFLAQEAVPWRRPSPKAAFGPWPLSRFAVPRALNGWKSKRALQAETFSNRRKSW